MNSLSSLGGPWSPFFRAVILKHLRVSTSSSMSAGSSKVKSHDPPVVQPTRCEPVIDLKSCKSARAHHCEKLLAVADEVIG